MRCGALAIICAPPVLTPASARFNPRFGAFLKETKAVATTQISVPDIDMKIFWRRFRAILWSVLIALAVTAIIVPSFEPIPFLTPLRNWMILLAVGVVAWPYFAKRWNV
jgi:hypothetical protein